MNIKDHWISKKGLPLKFDFDESRRARVSLRSGSYWYGISSNDRDRWTLIPQIFELLLSTIEDCDMVLTALLDARSIDGKKESEFGLNDFYLRTGSAFVQMEHAINIGCEVELEWELFEFALISWKEFLSSEKKET